MALGVALSAGCVALSTAGAATVENTIPVGTFPVGVSSDGIHVWVANEGSGTVTEIDATTGAVVNTIGVGEDPRGVSSDGVHVWVANRPAGTVREIDASTGIVINTIPVGTAPEGVSSDGTHVWVANLESASVSEIDPSTGVVIKTIAACTHPRGVSSDGTHVWVACEFGVGELDASTGLYIRTIGSAGHPEGVSSDGSHVWFTNSKEATVGEIDASAGTLINTIPVGPRPAGVSSDGTHVWVASFESATVSEIDASTGTVVETIPVGSNPYGVSADGTHVWIGNNNSSTVTEILAGGGCQESPAIEEDPVNQTVTEIESATFTAAASTPAACAAPQVKWLVKEPGGSSFTPIGGAESTTYMTAVTKFKSGTEYEARFVNSHGSTTTKPAKLTVNIASPGNAELVNTIAVGSSPYGVSSDGTHVWVVNNGPGTVSEIDASTGAVVNTIPVGSDPIAVSSDGTHVWVTNGGDNTVSEIDASTGAVINTIPVGPGPLGVSSDGTHVWVANHNSGETRSEPEPTITEIDASTGAVVNTIGVEFRPASFYGGPPDRVSSDGTHVWVTNGENAVDEIDASTGAVVETFGIFGSPGDVSSDGAHVWASTELCTHLGGDVCQHVVSEIGIKTIPLGEHRGFFSTEGVSSDGAHVWVTDGAEGVVREIDASTGTFMGAILVGSSPYGVSSDGTHVWVANTGSGTVSEILIRQACQESPAIEEDPANRTVTEPESATFAASGSTPSGCGAPTVKWLVKEPGGSSFTPIPGAESPSYMTGPTKQAQNGSEYEAEFTNEHGSTTTKPAKLTVDAPCTSVKGGGTYLLYHQPGRLNIKNDLSTGPSGSHQLVVKYESGKVAFRLTSLTKASCVALPKGLEFLGEGTAKLGKKKGETMTFSIGVVEGKASFSATIKDGTEVVTGASPLSKSTEVIH